MKNEGNYEKYVNKENLEKERKNLGLSYRNMSTLLGYNSSAGYYNIENGLVEPKISQMIKVASILKKPIDYFFNFKVQEI